MVTKSLLFHLCIKEWHPPPFWCFVLVMESVATCTERATSDMLIALTGCHSFKNVAQLDVDNVKNDQKLGAHTS
ncbi:ABC transporter C family member 8-like [Iris pallida]|uniref:ABC transporter C family member 8-like n=1 Tax=Iris pallida TaxID=29817 RepID=A0AAX6HKZ9_IRIPA|nr:ABC transporter C family member 8-like [Iris pallida]